MTQKELEDNILEVIRSLIYHGRHFSPTRDKIVIEKSQKRLFNLMFEYKK